MTLFETAIKQLNKMYISDYAVNEWIKRQEYKRLYGFFVAMANVAIINEDNESYEAFHNASLECINKF